MTYVQYQFSAAQWDSETDFLEAVIALHSLAAGQYAAGIHTTMHFDALDTPQDFDAGVRYASIWLFGDADTQMGERVQMELSGGGEGPTLLLYFYSDTDTAHNESYRLYLSEQG